MSTSDRRSKLFAYLEHIEYQPDMETLYNRKRIQKIVYIIQSLTNSFDYNYNWYIYGPYSPQLTTDVYDVIERKHSVQDYTISKTDQSKLNHIAKILQNDIRSTKKMELLASLLFLHDVFKRKRMDPDKHKQVITKYITLKKPYFTKKQVGLAWSKINKLKLIINSQN